ncbi:MAG: Asp23/Gls24 family envelope stress response protein [Lachnospiraceae bacterium]
MEDNRKSLKIKEDKIGEVRVGEEVVSIIAGLAATEVEGVGSMAGNITNEIVAKTGIKNLAKGVHVDVMDGIVTVDLDLNIKYGYAIPEVSGNVQERVRTAIETMTGLEVGTINVRIASVDMGDKKR